MKISDALMGVQRLGMDTSPFIYLVETHPTYYPLVEAIFREVDLGNLEAITSTITLTEVLTMPIAKQLAHYVRDYRDMLLNTNNITTLDISALIAESAAQLRAKYRLRTPDALQVATALSSSCDAFLTNDLGIKRVTELPILVLDELTL